MSRYEAMVAKWATLDGTKEEKLAAVNALTVTKRKPVVIDDLVAHLRRHGLWLKIKAAAANGNEGAIAAVDINQDLRARTIDLDLPIVGAMLDKLTEGLQPVLTGDERAAILALGNDAMPWWQASVADGGGGLTSPISLNDLIAAGLD